MSRRWLAIVVLALAVAGAGVAATQHRALRLHFRLGAFRDAAPEARASAGAAVIALGPEGEQALEALAFSDEDALASDPATPLRQAALDALARQDLLDGEFECVVPPPPARLPSYLSRARGLARPQFVWLQLRLGLERREGWPELLDAAAVVVLRDPDPAIARRCVEILGLVTHERERLLPVVLAAHASPHADCRRLAAELADRRKREGDAPGP